MSLSTTDLRALRRFYSRQGIQLVAAITDRSLNVASTLKLITVPIQPNGSEILISFGRGTIIRPVRFEATLITDAVVASRFNRMQISLTDIGGTINVQSNVTQLAGTQRTWCWTRGCPSVGIDTAFNAGNIEQYLPDLTLGGIFTVGTSTGSMDPGDHYASANFYFEQVS